MIATEAPPRLKLASPDAVRDLMCPRIGANVVEEVWVLPLDAPSCLIGKPLMLSRGGTSGCEVPLAPLMRLVLSRPTAVSFIVVHNHPAGSATPSADDLTITRRIILAARLLDLAMPDHCIIAGTTCASIRTTHPHLWIMPTA